MTIEANSAIPYAGNTFDDAETIAFREKLVNDVMTGNTERQVASEKAFGATLDDVEFFDYVYGAAVGWGGLPATHAQYAALIPGQGGTECSVVTFDVPNLDFDSDGFFSITTYSSEGWVDSDRFYIGHRDMQDNGDGTVTVHFNCPDIENSLEVTESWTGILRLYKPVDVDETINYVQNFLGAANVEAVR
jgi:hypothetical protein